MNRPAIFTFHLLTGYNMRVVAWFSAGVTSAVAAKLTVDKYRNDASKSLRVVQIVLSGEHDDNERYARDVEHWINYPITKLLPSPFPGHFEVVEKTRYVNGPTGARCTMELKRKTRERFQLPDDIHIFGFDAGESTRADEYRERFAMTLETPLIEAGLSKAECKGIMERAGIELPIMYKLGYSNNNCIGCVKGGMGYWNKIRVDFPAVFQRMGELERSIGHTVIRRKGLPLYLDELPPNAGRFDTDQPISCGPMCELITAKDRIELEENRV